MEGKEGKGREVDAPNTHRCRRLWTYVFLCMREACRAEKQLYEVHRLERQLELCERRYQYEWSTTSSNLRVKDESLNNVTLPRLIQVWVDLFAIMRRFVYFYLVLKCDDLHTGLERGLRSLQQYLVIGH